MPARACACASVRLCRVAFLRALALVYFFAFLSVVAEAEPLLGRHGLSSVAQHYKRRTTEGAGSALGSARLGSHSAARHCARIRMGWPGSTWLGLHA